LHAAAAAGIVDMVELFLRLGADSNVHDGGAHTPLYSLANECRQGGAEAVRVLVRAGGNVDAADGVKRCTPLHMAARRGNVEIAAALIDCGARIEARDSAGETPLRRAVNCDQVEVARLLLARGADPDSPGSRRLTPRLAARSSAMKQLLQSVDGARHP
jgi:ankyrin repeat protein